MYDDFFYDHVCTIYRNTDTVVNGAKKASKTAIYTDIKCAIRSLKQGNLQPSETARQHDTATHTINIQWLYPNLIIGDIATIGSREYLVTDLIQYTDIDDSTDNTSLLVRVR